MVGVRLDSDTSPLISSPSPSYARAGVKSKELMVHSSPLDCEGIGK
jgi:hypothetical protein